MALIGRAVWTWLWAEDGFCLVLLALMCWVVYARGAWGRWT